MLAALKDELFALETDRLHAGTAGVADERFYADVARYLDATQAPVLPRAA